MVRILVDAWNPSYATDKIECKEIFFAHPLYKPNPKQTQGWPCSAFCPNLLFCLVPLKPTRVRILKRYHIGIIKRDITHPQTLFGPDMNDGLSLAHPPIPPPPCYGLNTRPKYEH